MAHVVTAALVVIKDETGADHYHYQGAVLPKYEGEAVEKRLSDLVEQGMLDEVEDAEKKPARTKAPAES